MPKAAIKKSEHPAYKEMIIEAITELKERGGSSRQAIKKYITSNYKLTGSNFDVQFKNAVRKYVESEELIQPKGSSGPIKIAKKQPNKIAKEEDKIIKPISRKAANAKKAVKKSVPVKKTAKKVVPVKKVATKKAAPAKKTTVKKVVPVKKTTPKKAIKKAKTAPKKAAGTTRTRKARK